MTRKKPKKKNQATDETWFEVSAIPQTFLWRVEPDNGYLLLGGNRLGYEKLQRALARIAKGSAQTSVTCCKPGMAPPAQWHNSPLARRREAPIHEIEQDLRRTVKPFERFVWYRKLNFVLCLDGDVTCQLRGEELNVLLNAEQAKELETLIGDSMFPMFGGVLIGCSRNQKRCLVLSGDWLGAE